MRLLDIKVPIPLIHVLGVLSSHLNTFPTISCLYYINPQQSTKFVIRYSTRLSCCSVLATPPTNDFPIKITQIQLHTDQQTPASQHQNGTIRIPQLTNHTSPHLPPTALENPRTRHHANDSQRRPLHGPRNLSPALGSSNQQPDPELCARLR